MNIQAELISIGNELLSGRTLNTHGQDLGASLSVIGLQLVRDTTIPDELDHIGHAVNEALARVDLVFVSGGLGPTVDDITRDALAKVLNQKVVLDQPTVEYLTAWYKQRGRAITLAATRQAQVLEEAVVLPNSVGAAPGQRIELPGEKTLFVMPGPPKEFNAILNEEIIPWLKVRYTGALPKLVRIVQTKGIGESDIVTILENAGFQPANIDLGFYPGMGRVEIRLTALPDDEQEINAAAQSLRSMLSDHLDPDA
jgi:nicotinamide-nucleotide amidase